MCNGIRMLMRTVFLAALALLSVPKLSAQAAPQSIADSLVEINYRVSVFFSYELVWFRADGTYQDVINEGLADSNIGVQTYAPLSGTYTYAATAGMQNLGTITFTGNSTRGPVTFGYTPWLTEGGPFVNVYPRLALTGAVNVSNNSWISATHPTMPGFVIQGSSPRWVLIRGAGPSLAQFGVPSPVANPALTLSSGGYMGVNVQRVTDDGGVTNTYNLLSWTSDPNLADGFRAIFSVAGAFLFLDGSSDCAALVHLDPGAYVVQGSTTSSTGGQLLTEVYVLPYGN